MTAPASIEPLPESQGWTAVLEQVSSRPLEFCPDFPDIARRFEAWWAHDAIDRPIFIATANTNPARPINRRLELLGQPEAWLEAKLADLRQLHRLGDALPHIRVDFGPVLLGALFGGRLEFGSDTAWTHAFIDDDWSNEPDWTVRYDNPWYQLLGKLVELVSADAAGRYLVCTPDLGGSADVLLNLRGATGLCLDVIDRPERLGAAINRIYPAWRQVFADLYRGATRRGAGLIHWLGLWSDRPYVIPACDFNAMISPRQFRGLCLPDIARQAATVGRAVFHLDGPDAARHIDDLLEVPGIQAIQFTPGAGTPSAIPWLPMFQKIQARGRSLLIFCPPGEILEVCRGLRWEGLAILLEAPLTPPQLDDLLTHTRRRLTK
ncbi:MAG TPA: hypothetical protein PKY77_00965 [Phycisphaerae bacterium]|nr:hypothetical protein [Phycisphaerae bacterium]HRY67574.1 hypothetical protein [Phycisphaerae bacterium]HSA24961.1 hypothetical protein [Phycisphaerae bacterium]